MMIITTITIPTKTTTITMIIIVLLLIMIIMNQRFPAHSTAFTVFCIMLYRNTAVWVD